MAYESSESWGHLSPLPELVTTQLLILQKTAIILEKQIGIPSWMAEVAQKDAWVRLRSLRR